MSFWHGGNLDNLDDINDIAHKGGRYEFGPGIYMTTSWHVAQKYAKGSRKLYLLTVKKGIDLKNTDLDLSVVTEFINTTVIKNKRSIVIETINNIIERMNKGNVIKGDTFLNILMNNDAIKNTDTIKLKQFFRKNKIDYSIVDNAFGWGEKMLILFNNDLLVDITRVNSKDKIEVFELPTKFNESVNIE